MPLAEIQRIEKKISVRARRARSAITHYSLEEEFWAGLSFKHPDRDRQNATRFAFILAQKGHPVVVILYMAPAEFAFAPKAFRGSQDLRRPFLHSRRCSSGIPRSGEILSFDAPLPPELERFLSFIRQ